MTSTALEFVPKVGAFGAYGGRFVSELLMPALLELEAAEQRLHGGGNGALLAVADRPASPVHQLGIVLEAQRHHRCGADGWRMEVGGGHRNLRGEARQGWWRHGGRWTARPRLLADRSRRLIRGPGIGAALPLLPGQQTFLYRGEVGLLRRGGGEDGVVAGLGVVGGEGGFEAGDDVGCGLLDAADAFGGLVVGHGGEGA